MVRRSRRITLPLLSWSWGHAMWRGVATVHSMVKVLCALTTHTKNTDTGANAGRTQA